MSTYVTNKIKVKFNFYPKAVFIMYKIHGLRNRFDSGLIYNLQSVTTSLCLTSTSSKCQKIKKKKHSLPRLVK